MAVTESTAVLSGTGQKAGDVMPGWSITDTSNTPQLGIASPGAGGTSISLSWTDYSEFLQDKTLDFRPATDAFEKVAIGRVSGQTFSGSEGQETVTSVSLESWIGRMNVERTALPVLNQQPYDALVYYISLAIPGFTGLTYLGATRLLSGARSFPGWTGNVWEYVNGFLAAFGQSMRVAQRVDGTTLVVVENTEDVLELDVDERTQPTLSFDPGQAGQFIEVVYQNPIVVSSPLSGVALYDAQGDDNNILSVSAGSIAEFSLPSNKENGRGIFAQSVEQPTPVYTLPIAVGQYHVIDSSGLPIQPQQWLDYGGSLSISIQEDSTLLATLTAPLSDIPSTTGPYRIASSDGQTERAELKVAGVGVVTDPKVLSLPTGADPSLVKGPLAQKIQSPFVLTLQDAYTVGIAAAGRSNGVYRTVNLSVPPTFVTTAEVDMPTNPVSRRFTLRGARYRVSSATTRRVGVDITAIEDTLLSEYDTIAGTRTLGQHEAIWNGLTLRDFESKPLRTE